MIAMTDKVFSVLTPTCYIISYTTDDGQFTIAHFRVLYFRNHIRVIIYEEEWF